MDVPKSVQHQIAQFQQMQQQEAQRQRDLRSKAEANLETALKRKEELENQIREKGYDPDKLPEEIEKLNQQIEEKLNRAAELLNVGV